MRIRHPGRFSLALITLLFLACGLGMYGAREYMLAQVSADPDSARNLALKVDSLKKALVETRGELEMVRTRHAVDREALELVRRGIAEQKNRAAELDEDLRFYRSLMAPEDVASSFSVRPPELVRSDRPDHYRFSLVVQQKARQHEMLTGRLTVNIVGLAAGLDVSYPLEEVSADFSEESQPLKFRYFQAFAGEIMLPAGFEPTAIAVVARVTKPKKAEVIELFPWQLQERFNHAGK